MTVWVCGALCGCECVGVMVGGECVIVWVGGVCIMCAWVWVGVVWGGIGVSEGVGVVWAGIGVSKGVGVVWGGIGVSKGVGVWIGVGRDWRCSCSDLFPLFLPR